MRIPSRSLRALSTLAALVVSGCSNGTDSVGDDVTPPTALPADPTAGGGVFAVEIAPPAAPALPALPALTPCAPGWVERGGGDAGGPATCEPSSGDATECAVDEARFVGEPGCTRIGAACPATGEFADGLAPTGVVYVGAGAAPGGDGSRDAPFATVPEALAVATAGTTIALSRGDHAPPGMLPAGVTVRGACVAATRVLCTTAVDGFVLDAPGAAVRDLHVEGCTRGLRVDRGTSADYRIDGVLVTGATRAGWTAFSGTGTVDRLVVRDVSGDATVELSGVGVSLASGARATAHHVVIERSHSFGVHVAGGGTSLTIDDVAVRDVRPDLWHSVWGVGLIADTSAELHVERALVDGSRGAGVEVDFPGSRLDAADLVVRHVTSRASDDENGVAALASLGGTLTVRRALFEDNAGGAHAIDEGTSATLEDVVVRRNSGSVASGTGGAGFGAAWGAAYVVRRGWVEGAVTNAAASVGTGTSMVTEDLSVRGTTPARDGRFGVGVGAEAGGTFEVTRALVSDIRLAGVLVIGADTVVRAADVTVERVDVQVSDGLGACGLCASNDGRLEVDRAAVRRVHGIGVAIGAATTDRSTLVAHDLRVSDTLSADGRQLTDDDGSERVADVAGYGIGVIGGRAEVTRFVAERSAITGISASFGGQIVGVDVVASDGTGRTTDGDFGYGVFADMAASIALTRARVSDNRIVGIGGAEDATLALQDVLVERTGGDPAGELGHGLQLDSNATATVTHMLVREARNVGVYVAGAGLAATDLRVLDTLAQECASRGCQGGGFGVGAYDDARVVITDFIVTGSALCGVQLARAGRMDLHQGEVSFSRVGANVDVAGFDLGRLSDHVVYHDNERNLDSQSLPVPRAGMPPTPTVVGAP